MRYLLITYSRQPNGQIDEQVGFVKVLKSRDLQTASVIVDYQDKKIVKCVIEGKIVETDYEKMDEYYHSVYPELITQLRLIHEQKIKNHEK